LRERLGFKFLPTSGECSVQRFFAIMLAAFAATLFVSATLLFLVQPMIGKIITPLLGGTPAVWNTCMVFFQAVLLAGYAYSHGTTAWLGVRRQAVMHVAVLLVPFLFFPLSVNAELMHGWEENPIPALLILLFVSVGPPFFVVSTSAPLLQKWFASTPHPAARDPYFLYGSSNLGSMLALVGYPFVYEYFVPLSAQSNLWVVGYAVLVCLIGGCAVLLWLSPRIESATKAQSATNREGAVKVLQGVASQGTTFSKRGKGRPKLGSQPAIGNGQAADQSDDGSDPLADSLTWRRRLRWVILAAVPSSLMLGVTTYMTTDIAAIPLLWLPPLTLYLLTFIIVFARVPRLVHRSTVLLMPPLLLLAVFLMLTGIRPAAIEYSIALHLLTLFVVAMVCHGELARDRPGPKSLTEFFLWMSVGGVLGGLLNGLVAPVVFVGNAEYPLALVGACLLLPPLGFDIHGGKWGRVADIGLASFCFLTGLVLIVLGWRDDTVQFSWIANNYWGSCRTAVGSAYGYAQSHVALLAVLCLVVAALAFAGAFGLRRLWQGPKSSNIGLFDVLLPLGLMVLVAGLLWGLRSEAIEPHLISTAKALHVKPTLLFHLVTVGLPLVLCFTFVQRPIRFGLGVGVILLAATLCASGEEKVIFQTRSFFGIIRVELDYPFVRLMHGTTLHGMQYLDVPDFQYDRDEPITYYMRDGPVGDLFAAFNPSVRALGASAGPLATTIRLPGVRPNLGVIGLGTGTVACYAEAGQHLTYYEIDPAIRDISFVENAYFTYVPDARHRHVIVEDLVMGDARLTLQRQQLSEEEKYGILVIDAFSSDAIPIHLLNRNAMRVFLDKLSANGVIAFHVSNRHLDLLPVVANIAEAEGIVGLYLMDHADEPTIADPRTDSTWVVLARKPEDVERLNDMAWQRSTGVSGWGKVQPLLRSVGVPAPALEPRWRDLSEQRDPRVGVWTDDYSNLLSVFRW
jgi:hypothetical protein